MPTVCSEYHYETINFVKTTRRFLTLFIEPFYQMARGLFQVLLNSVCFQSQYCVFGLQLTQRNYVA